MISLIAENLKAIKEFCVRYRVGRLEVFGSAADSKNFDLENSDLDFLVEFQPLKPGEYADTYFGLLEALETLFKRHVDLVMVRAVKNPYFLEYINRNRKLLYAA
jgi:predicted nucleotidyltransferase